MWVTVCKGGGPGGVDIGGGGGGGGGVVVSEISVAWGKRGEGGQGREGVQLPDSLMDKAVLQSVVLAWRLRSLLPDGSRLKKLCVGWVGSPAMLRALRVRRVL